MMQSADVRDLDDRAAADRLLRPASWCILVQREVGAPVVVVGEVLLEVTAERAVVPHDDVVEALAPQGADHALHERMLPGRTRRRQHLRRCPWPARHAERPSRRSEWRVASVATAATAVPTVAIGATKPGSRRRLALQERRVDGVPRGSPPRARTRTTEAPEGGEQGDEQRWHAPTDGISPDLA